MAMVAVQSEMPWQPSKAVVASVSMLVTGVVLTALVFMFAGQPEPAARILPVEIRLISALSSVQSPSIPKVIPVHRAKLSDAPALVSIIKVENIPLKILAPISPPFDWQQQIKISINSQVLTGSNPSSLVLKKPLEITPLEQALNAPRKPDGMQNGDSYRDVDGNLVVKADGKCLELKTLQFGPSPSDRVTLAQFPPFNCSGDYEPTMADELSKWVQQEARKRSPP